MTAGAMAAGRSPSVASLQSAADIPALSALELSHAVRTRQLSCVELLGASLDRVEALNGRFNAIVSLRSRASLLEEAAGRDRELKAGVYRGWMHGFPHAVKDLADAEGLPTTSGSLLFKDAVASRDAIHVARIKAAGAIVIGKTNVPEFGLGSQTYNRVFGATLNAYDGVSTAGGSSGGAAAALALGMVPVADGSDLMGSLRNPAAFNNVIGFRPTVGLVPQGDTFREELPCNGPMGRTVQDTAMLLSTMAGHHPGSPNSLHGDRSRFTQPLARDWRGTKVGWLGDFDGYLAMEDGLLALCEQALGGFRELGCEVDAADVGYPMDALWHTWLTYRHWLVRARGLPLYQDPRIRAQLKPELIWEVEGGASLTLDDLNQAIAARGEWHQALLRTFATYDFLVLPSTQAFPFPATQHWPQEIAGRRMDTYHRWMEVVVPGTLSGGPVINVPAGFNEAGLPAGLQIIAPRHQDGKALQLAYAYEQATRWNLDHSPPISALKDRGSM